MSTNKSIARSAGVIGLATMASRILGFIRDVVIARVFGVYLYAQAFVIAFKVPNLFRDFIGEGATNAAFVPVFSDFRARRSQEEFWELANVILVVLSAVLITLTLAGILFSPQIIRLIAPGFLDDPQKFSATVALNRAIFPYIILIGLTAYATGILNTLKHFAFPAFAPCLLNLSIIICALIFGEGLKGLALGVLAGGMLQLAIQIPVLYYKGFRLKFPRTLKHPQVKVIGKLMAPRVLSTSIYQLNNFVDSIFGSLGFIVGEGGVAVLYFAYRLILFPLGIFSTSLSQALLPTFSAQALEDSPGNLKKTLCWALRANFFLLLPASAAFMVLAGPIISGLFGAGKFDAYSIRQTASALFFYSFGLFAYGGTRILQSCFFALKDTMTPTKVAGLALLLNIVLNAVLIFPLEIGGIALATSISGIIGFLLLFNILKNRLGDFETSRVIGSFLKILSASIAMAATCYILSRQRFIANRCLNLILITGTGLVSYAAFCLIFRVHEMKELWGWVSKKK